MGKERKEGSKLTNTVLDRLVVPLQTDPKLRTSVQSDVLDRMQDFVLHIRGRMGETLEKQLLDRAGVLDTLQSPICVVWWEVCGSSGVMNSSETSDKPFRGSGRCLGKEEGD